ncbi:MAG: CoA pyrophosphatase [FCB group bacterium]|nr:CoA pyrophosphatase [FCB group bacterium]
MADNTLITKLTERLREQLPGQPAQVKMMARPRVPITYPGSPEHAIPSAVLILLFPRGDDIRFYLTQRTHAVEHHKGQISLPGGAWEEGERLPDTAMRETYEEIGVRGDGIRLLGALTPLFVPVTGFMIHPFIGWLNYEPLTNPDPAEVETLFSVSVNSLIDDNIIGKEERTIRGFLMHIPFFKFGDHKVWGATAMILSEFKTLLKEIL